MVSTKLKNTYKKKNTILKNSPSKGIVDKFDKNVFSTEVFHSFKSQPYLRTLFKLVLKSFDIEEEDSLLTVQYISEYIEENIKNSLSKPIYLIQLCDNCGHSLNSYNNYTQNRPKGKNRCPVCRTINNLSSVKQEEEWSYLEGETYSLLEIMSQYEIIKKEMRGLCYNCGVDVEINSTKLLINRKTSKKELTNYLSEIYCQKCNELYDVYKLYLLNSDKEINFWKDGYWLEWYVKKLCEASFPTSLIEQGVIVKRDNVETEIDVMLYKSGKFYGIECKAFNPTKKARTNNVADILNYSNLVDHSILVISSSLDSKARLLLQDKEVTIIENHQIEDIGKILKKI